MGGERRRRGKEEGGKRMNGERLGWEERGRRKRRGITRGWSEGDIDVEKK